MRNEAAHKQGLALSPEEAQQYALAASDVVGALELHAGVPTTIEDDAPSRVDPLSEIRITVTVRDDEGALVGAVPISVVKVEGGGEVDDIRGGYTSAGYGAFTYLAPLNPGQAVLVIRVGAAGQQVRSTVTIRVGD